ncbi:MAG: hypothetical protein Q4Q62_00755 [Thermoplasmata archaeon]|nr:hypothetical protein [Thermoplasmata archaeon]
MAVVLAILMAIANKPVRKYRVVLYVIVVIIEAYFVFSKYFEYDLITDNRQITSMLTMGILSEALFAVVAYMGCLPSNHWITKRFKSVRAELSVMGCIMGFAQMIYYANSFVQFFNGELSTGRTIACIATLVLLCLMIPLMLTSFYCVRANMKQSSWKKLQKTSYIFYFMLWVHILGLYGNFNGGLTDIFSGKHGETLECYTVIWGVYFILRFCKFLYDRHKGVKSDDGIIQDDDDLVPARGD